MEPSRPKWSPGGPDGTHETQMEPMRPKWSSGDPNGAQLPLWTFLELALLNVCADSSELAGMSTEDSNPLKENREALRGTTE